MTQVVIGIILLIISTDVALAQSGGTFSPRKIHHLSPEDIAVVVNDADPNSVRVANYYVTARHVPPKNIVHVKISGSPKRLSLVEFTRLKWEIDTQIEPGIQALLLVWSAPYAVACNSITAALAMGLDIGQCKNGCAVGKDNPYFNADSARPFNDYGFRLVMLLPAESFQQAKALIDRGVQSDQGVFRSTAYYLVTSDQARSSRAPFFPPSGAVIARTGLQTMTLKSDKLIGVQDVMIYETGMPWVDGLETLKFLPGALADHLTSFGGVLDEKKQMSVLRWLDAGATASYGTVSEPCNYWQKFPNPAVLLKWYTGGATAIEAYWKSVAWPAQGLFVGEPLAAPYGQ